MHPLVPGWSSCLSAGGIQSPYSHRASGLVQIAVSTMLRTNTSGSRKFLYAEHCRYGTRDLGLIDELQEIAAVKPVSQYLSDIHGCIGSTSLCQKGQRMSNSGDQLVKE